MRALRSIAVAGVAFAAIAASIGGASADPTVAPKTTDLVFVGSDTITPLFDQWSTDFNATAPTNKMYSWDATGSANIQTKGTAGTNPPTTSSDPNCYIPRPNGSSAGISQLTKGALTHDSKPCVDGSRSSRALKSSDGTGLAAVALGRDIITQSFVKGGNALASLDDGELTAIFSCDASQVPTGDRVTGQTYGVNAPVTWKELAGGTSTDQIVPVLPQAGSGTLATWESDLKLKWTTAPACIVNGKSTVDGSLIEENEGTNSEFTTANTHAKDVVFGYSAGVYLGETVFHTNPQGAGNMALGEIDGKSAITTAGNALNISGFPGTYVRTLYAVVKSSGASPWIPTNLQPLLGAGNQTGFNCKGSSTTKGTGPYDLAQQGFAPAVVCGLVTHQ